jgi:uncharacterized membrane protein
MLMNMGLLLLIALVFSYVLIPPIFTHGSYLEAVRARYRNILGGEWTRQKHLVVEAGAALIVICLVLLLTFLTSR